MSLDLHNKKIEVVSEEIRKYFLSDKKDKIRFYHGSTNSTRPNSNSSYIDISSFDEILEISASGLYALVEPKVSMETLVKATLKLGLIPLVVMEFPKITCGGAINGASLESSSFKYGQLSDTCTEYEIILGNGEKIIASKENHQDIFYGISGSYGSLGLITSIKLRLTQAKKYIKTTYLLVASFQEALDLIKKLSQDRDLNYLDAIMYSSSHGVIITGERSDISNLPIKTYSKIRDLWFYERAQKVTTIPEEELVPIQDYLFRYNRGGFWMGEFAFPLLGIPNNKITRFLFNGYAKTHKLYEALHTLNVSQEYFLQDIYFPLNETLACLEYNDKEVGIYPLWLCPVKSTSTEQKLSPHYIDSDLLIDVGIWGQTPKYLANPIGVNKKFEQFTKDHNGRKMLYAHAYYSESEFWEIYNNSWYISLRKKYFADKIFPDVWSKTHVSGYIRGNRWKGFLKYFFVNPIKNKYK
ncbi:MAG TPA: FAD-binding protein [Candidatus Paceibacterota bacterium]